ncbi:MAG: sensor histidine kinase [Anaerolineae bacterium]|nr:sensor histidine kinase [Anaerolineae bacterium]
MSLTQQFLLLSLLPLAFLVLIGQLQRPQRQHRSTLIWLWSLTLLLAAVWASGILSYFMADNVPLVFLYNWRIVSRYSLGLFAAGVYLTSTTYLNTSSNLRNVPLVFYVLLWVGAILLDPLLRISQIGSFAVGEQVISQFDLWAAIWVTSWFLPLFAAWLLTRQAYHKVPTSLYRNQINYWFFALSGFMVAGVPGIIQQVGQSGWWQLSAMLYIAAATVATLSLTRDRLPDLQITLRQNVRRLFFVILVFLLSLGGLLLLTQTEIGADIRQTLPGLTLAAAGFSFLIALLYRLINQLFRPFVPLNEEGGAALLPVNQLEGTLGEPRLLAEAVLAWIQQKWQSEDAWLVVVEEENERVWLRPQAGLNDNLPEPASFTWQSPFITYLQRNPTQPLIQYDIDILNDFEEMLPNERAILREWERLLYLPLHAGNKLVGVLALGKKQEHATYTPNDFSRLTLLAGQFGPIFYLSRQINHLSQTYQRETSEHRHFIERANRWEAVSKLYGQYLHLISPDLRKALGIVESQWQRTYNEVTQNEGLITLPDHLTKPLADFKVMMDRLITVSGRIQKQSDFHFTEVRLDDVIRSSIGSLAAMADARRVQIDAQSLTHHLPPIRGDAQRLQEAVQFLLHNAIKFNKIGGKVEVNYGRQDDDLYVRVTDNGVGIAEERLAVVWLGLIHLNQTPATAAGMGLGLPLTRFIVEAHGGRVEAQSTHGAGSTFTIYLPIGRNAL